MAPLLGGASWSRARFWKGQMEGEQMVTQQACNLAYKESGTSDPPPSCSPGSPSGAHSHWWLAVWVACQAQEAERRISAGAAVHHPQSPEGERREYQKRGTKQCFTGSPAQTMPATRNRLPPEVLSSGHVPALQCGALGGSSSRGASVVGAGVFPRMLDEGQNCTG